jgi:hypothetical protein
MSTEKNMDPGSAGSGSPVSQARKRRSSTTVERLAPRKSREWSVTGELDPVAGRDREESKLVPGLWGALDPVPTAEVDRALNPRAQRVPHRWELRLEALFAGAVIVLVGAFFAEGGQQAIRRAKDGPLHTLWREMPIRISSDPAGAKVFVSDTLRGVSPLKTLVYCRGQQVRVRVETPGYEVWESISLCPREGELRLEALLVPRKNGL